MAIPVNTPAESTLNLGAVPEMLKRTTTTPNALTSAGNTGPGVAMRNHHEPKSRTSGYKVSFVAARNLF